MVLIRHILHGQVYGETGQYRTAVLRPAESWTGIERRRAAGVAK
jgi:hypothetical protein